MESTTPLQATGHQACSAASSGVCDPRGIRQMDADARLAHCPRKSIVDTCTTVSTLYHKNKDKHKYAEKLIIFFEK